MGDTPSSDDLIRQSREALASSSFDQTTEDDDLPLRPPSVTDRIYQDRERVEQPAEPPRRHLFSVPREPVQPAAGPETPARSGGGTAWKVFGIVILVSVVLFWVLLLLGIALDPEDAGSAVLGGVVLSVVPVALGVLFLRRGSRG